MPLGIRLPRRLGALGIWGVTTSAKHEPGHRGPYVLGIDIGSGYTKAAIRRRHRSGMGGNDSLVLGAGGAAVPSVLHVDANASALVGDAAEDGGPAERDQVARGFVRRIGDQVPFVLGGTGFPADELFATMLSWVIDQATHQAGGAPEQVAVTQPAGWSTYQLNVLRSALDQFGLGGVTLVPELTAAALDYAVQRRVGIGDLIAVCDLGGSGYRAAVLRRSSETGFELLARPEQAEPPGTDPDEAVLVHVRAELGSELDQIDLAEPGAWRAALALRRECTAALEKLVAEAEAVVGVSLPGFRTTVTVTRQRVEDAVRPAALEGAELVRGALRSAGVHSWKLSAVLLVGGWAQMPLVPQVLSTELRRPVAVAANPKATMARGAAVAAMHAAWPGSVSIAPAPGRELSRVGAAGSAMVPRDEVASDETIVLFTGQSPDEERPRSVPDLDEVADEVPPRPSVELSPLPFDIDYEPISEQPMWKRVALGGGAVGGIVLVLACVAWFVFGNPLQSKPAEQPLNQAPAPAAPPPPPPTSMREGASTHATAESRSPSSSRTTPSTEVRP